MEEGKVVGMTTPTTTTPVYDPNKKYTWTNEDTFTFTGGEFGLILNTLRGVLSTEEAGKILLAQQANSILEKHLSKAVEAGIVVEATS
jgi:hypothetical protein